LARRRPKYHRLLAARRSATDRAVQARRHPACGGATDWMRAQFFANRADDRPAERKPLGRVSPAAKRADRIRCLCDEAGHAVLSGGAGEAAMRTRFPLLRSGGRGCGR